MHWAKELVLCVSVSPLLEHGHPFRPGWYVLCGNWDREDPCECPENLIFQMRMPYEYGRLFSSHLSSLRVKESRTLGPRQVQETIHTDGETRLSGVTQVGGEEKWGFVLGSFSVSLSKSLLLPVQYQVLCRAQRKCITQPLPSRNIVLGTKTGNRSLAINSTNIY